jgi:hypothetical protein
MSYKSFIKKVIDECHHSHNSIKKRLDLKFDPNDVDYFGERVLMLWNYLKFYEHLKEKEHTKKEVEEIRKNYLEEQDELGKKGNLAELTEQKKKFYEQLLGYLVCKAEASGLLKEEIPREKLEETKGELPP